MPPGSSGILILSSLDPLLGEPSQVVYYLHNTLTLDPLLVLS